MAIPGSNVVIDVSHHNGNVNFKKVADAGIVGVIHKATQGQTGTDNQYAANRKKAEAAGLLWGAYHFGTDSDGVSQAEHFLDFIGNPKDMLLVLDYESNPTGPTMTIEEARAFVTHVNAQTGRFPGFYSGHDIKQVLGASNDSVLAQCWFWLAQYGPTPVVPPNWKKYTLWQYTDGSLGPEPHTIPGAGAFDRDTFNGTIDELKQFWKS
jgi:lysozyme